MITSKKLKFNRVACILALLHWFISFASDRLVFTYQLFDFSNVTSIAKAVLAWGAKLGFFLLLIIIWHFILYWISELKNGNKSIREYLKYSAIYFGIMLLFFVGLFPGLWRMDEFGILRNATNILPDFWQGYLTSVFYIFALMIIPNPAGILLVQVGVISFIVGHIIYKCSNLLRNQWLVYALYLPFLLFPVIDSNFYPIRMSLYAFLELLFVFELFMIKYENREIKMNVILLLAGLAGILICWRTEAIYYIVLAPVTFIILFYKETSRKTKIQFTIATFVIAMALTSVQMVGNKMTSGDEYELTSLMLPITPLVNEAYVNGDDQIIETVDKVLDTDVLIKGYNEGRTGIAMYWDSDATNLKRAYSSEDFANLKSAYYKLIIKYPEVFLKERVETFVGSTGLLNNTQTLFDKDALSNYVNFRETYHYSEPFIRSDLINLIEFIKNEKLHNVIYNALPQTIILLGACVVLLFQKKWGYFFILANVCAKIPLIFLTAPSRLFMYYYSIYLIGAVMIGFLLIFEIDARIKNRK